MSLQQAARRDDVATLQEILHTQLGDKVSALITAAYFNHTDCLKVLIKSGVDVNQTDTSGTTALIAAAQAGIQKVIISSYFNTETICCPYQAILNHLCI